MTVTGYLVSQTPVTVPKPFNLGLSKRVEERQQYREEQDKRQKESDARDKVVKDEQEEMDKKELKDYRKSLVFKVVWWPDPLQPHPLKE